MSLILSGTDGLSDVDGSAATPAIRGTDANTGIFFPAADTIGFSEGGAEVARFDSSGNFGLGVTPSAWSSSFKVLQLANGTSLSNNGQTSYYQLGANNYFDGSNYRYIASNFAGFHRFSNLGAYEWQIASSGTAGNAITFTQAMTLDASGNFGIGTASPSDRLDVRFASGTGTVKFGVTSSNNVKIYNTAGDIRLLSSDASSDVLLDSQRNVIFNTGNSERARINSSGQLLWGTTSTFGNYLANFYSADLNTTNNGIAVKNNTNNTNGIFFSCINYLGNVIGSINQNASTTVQYSTSSDYRLKEDIQPMTGALEKVALLKPVIYKWKTDGSAGQGFIAHELAEVVPDAVSGEKDAVETYTDEDGNEQTRPRYQGIDTSFLVATLTAAIQEQQALITTLTARITALESA